MDLIAARKKRNEEVLRKRFAGESLATCTLEDTWFPQRSIIKKSPREIERLYGVQKEEIGKEENERQR